jgi:hypothetical protein
VVVILYDSHAAGDYSPKSHDSRQEDRRSSFGEDKVARDFEEDIADEEYDERHGVLVAAKMEILVHPCNLCIADVCPVHVAHKVHQPYRRHEEEVDLSD